MQPAAAEPVRSGDNVVREAERRLLREAEGAEAVPVPVHEES